MKRVITTLFVIIIFAMTLSAKDDTTEMTPKDYQNIIRELSESVVIVEYHLQYDNGEAPESVYTYYRCPNCGSMHSRNSGKESISEKRALETSGFIISEDIVLTTDIGVQQRFIKSIIIKQKNSTAEAKIVSYAVDENAVFLKLETPLKGSRPLTFDKKQEKPFYNLSHKMNKTKWCLAYYPMGGTIVSDPFATNINLAEEQVLITTTNGIPVGISMNGILPLDDSWKGNPLQWKQISNEDMNQKLELFEKYVSEAIPRVQLNFRSPEADSNSRDRYAISRDDFSGIEMNCLGIAVSTNQVWVMTSLPPKATARLEKITIFDGLENQTAAKFKYNLKEYGILVVETEKPLKNVIKLSQNDLRKDFNKLMLRASLKVAGEKTISHFWHCRISDAEIGYLNTLYPQIPGPDKNSFVFDLQQNLVALPIILKEQADTDRWSRDDEEIVATELFSSIVANAQNHIDKNNKPMSKEDAARVAWMGLELQGLNMNLARANNATEETQGGETGALINYVYTNSPASKAGIEPGMILLRLFVKDNPKPINIELDDYDYNHYQRDDIRENMNSIPVEYLNKMPPPWQGIENTFTLMLTKVGFDKPYTAEFFDNGKIIRKDFVVERSPVHYNAAKKYKDKELGVSVKDLTFEVLRYMQKSDDAPGLIISKVEPGSKADIAGIKTYEIITSINGKPINTLDDFKKVVKDDDELMITIERMNKPRQIRIVQSEKTPEKEEEKNSTAAVE